MRNVRRAVLIIVLLCVGYVASTQLYSMYRRNARLIVVGEQRLDPLAPVREDKRYGIVIWEQPLLLPGNVPDNRRLALETAAAEFSEQFPNVTIEIAIHDDDDFVGHVRQAALAGVGPDIVGLANPGLLLDTEWQIPVTPYLSASTAEDIIPAVRQALYHDDTVWAWPRWAVPTSWIAWRSAFGDDVPSHIAGAHTLQQYIPELRRFTGDRPPIAYNGFDPGTFVSIAVASGGQSLLSGYGEMQWSEALLTDVAAWWHGMAQDGTVRNDTKEAAMSRLSTFDKGEAAIVAAPAWSVLQLMLSRYGDIRHDMAAWAGDELPALLLMSAPYVSPAIQGTWGHVAAYAVLLRDPNLGDDHIVVAMRVAEYLSRRVGAWEAAVHAAVPAYASSLSQWEIDSGLTPSHIRSLYGLSQYLISPPVPYEWATLETAALTDVFVPSLTELIEGNMSPEQFARRIRKDMPAYVAEHRGKPVSSLQIH